MALLINCPICGRRNAYEFRYGGEEKGPYPWGQNPDPAQWCRYVHMNSCTAGVQQEWWYHRDGCAKWFTIFRDTVRNIQVNGQEET